MKNITTSSSLTLTTSGGFRALIIGVGAQPQKNMLGVIVRGNNSQTVNYYPLIETGSDLTVEGGQDIFTISTSGTSSTGIYMVVFHGENNYATS